MSKLWIAAALGAALALAGCASVKDDFDSLQIAWKPISQEFRSKLSDPALIQLGEKITYFNSADIMVGDDDHSSYRILSNGDEKPSDADREALNSYISIKSIQNKKQEETAAKLLSRKQKQSLHVTNLLELVLLTDLKNRILTWNEFNKRNFELNKEFEGASYNLWKERLDDERETKAAMAAFGQALAQGAQQYGNSLSRAYAPQQYGSSQFFAQTYQPATTWTSNGNFIQGSNGVTIQSFGNRDVITFPDGQTRNCSTFGNITTCSSP